MGSAINAFLAGLVDYAGLFPPAKLDMEPAIGNYAAYQDSGDVWILGNFICPASRLDELYPLARRKIPANAMLPLSVLGRPATDSASFRNGFAQDLLNIKQFRDNYGENCRISVFEQRLPQAIIGKNSAQELAAILAEMARGFLDVSMIPPTFFFEAPREESWRGDWEKLTTAIRHNRRDEVTSVGFKLRCGGVESHMYPTIEQVAAAIALCDQYDIPFKATAGLHHPVRHFNEAAGVMMHGFVNVFGATLLCTVHHLPESIIAAIIAEEDSGAFSFTDEAFHWRDWEISAADIEISRREAVASFGSCSFDEPREDLRELNWLS